MSRSKELIAEGYVKVCAEKELKEGEGKRFLVDDVETAVFKVEGKLYAVSNICPHQHTNLIYDGFIEDGCVVCPLHGWKFCLETGNMPTGRRGLDTYKAEAAEGNIYVKTFKRELKW